MPTRNISLTAEQDAFVENVVRAGHYQNASEAVCDALRVLHQCRREDSLTLKVLRARIGVGVESLKQGDFLEIEESRLEEYLAGLPESAAKRAR